MDCISDLSILPGNLRPPYFLQADPKIKPIISDYINQKEKSKWDQEIIRIQSSPMEDSTCVTECWERLHRILELKSDEKSTVKTFQTFFPKSIVAHHFCPSFGNPSQVKVSTVWDYNINDYEFQTKYIWNITDKLILEKTLWCVSKDIRCQD